MQPRSPAPDPTSDLEHAFRRAWAERLDRVLPVAWVAISVVVLAQAAAPLLTAIALLLVPAGNMTLSRFERRAAHFLPGARGLLNATVDALVVHAAGPTGHGSLILLIGTVGCTSVPTLAGQLFITLFPLAVSLAVMWLDGAAPEELASTVTTVGVVMTVNLWMFRDLLASRVAAGERERALERALAFQKAFLATMSHEIRTPLNGVIGMLDVVEATSLDVTQRRALAVIRESGRGLVRVVNDILDYAKLEAGGMVLVEAPYDPHHVVLGVSELLHSRVRGGVRLAVDAPGLPEWVLGDGDRVRQVLLNLTGNALKFTERGRVVLRARWKEGTLTFEVRDTGPGIPPERLAALFTPFSQVDPSARGAREGTGLGLTISRELVTLMGGTITVESVVGAGSTFTVTIPTTTCAAPEGRPSPSVTLNRALTVLVADDNAINRLVARRILEMLGCEVIMAESGREAIARMGDHVSVVLMDCSMPDMDGVEATQHLRAAGCTVPIIAYTAGVTTDERRRCLDAGMQGFLAKPASRDEVAEVLARWGRQTAPPEPV